MNAPVHRDFQRPNVAIDARLGPSSSDGPRAKIVRYARHRRGMFAGGALLALIFLTCLLGPLALGLDSEATNLRERFLPPVWSHDGVWNHPLGTDNLGRDILARVLVGGQVSLAVAFFTVSIAVFVGLVLGVAAGYREGWLDSLIMRVGDLFLAYPFMLLTISVIAILGASLTNLIIVLALSDWVVYARTVRASVLSLKHKEFVTAARSIGSRDGFIIRRHIIPNVLSPVLVLGTVRAANYIIWESGLSFLGMGVPPPTATWGMMLAEGRNYMLGAWWLATAPGLAIMMTILCMILLGDGLRDALDPRLRNLQK